MADAPREDPSKTVKGPEQELHPSLASDPPTGVTGPAARLTFGLLGWILLGLLAIVVVVVALDLLQDEGPGAPATPDVIVQPNAPPTKPADLDSQ